MGPAGAWGGSDPQARRPPALARPASNDNPRKAKPVKIRTLVFSALALAASTGLAAAQSQAAVSAAQKACMADAKAICSGVAPGGGRILKCLQANMAQVSQPCQQALAALQASQQ
jgi:hypothetical protein